MSYTAVQYGVGPIGSRIVEAARDRGVEFVGAIDVDPAKVGADLGRVAGLDRDLGCPVTDDVGAAMAAEPDVVFHATASSVETVSPQLVEALGTGADVVSTTEELAYPWRTHRAVAERLDAAAREHGATCLGTGINPGFAMDVLPAVATAPCRSVDSIRVERIQAAGTRRGPLQAKVGAGLSVEDWEAKIPAGGGHVGLVESASLLADGIGWTLDDITTTIEPVVANARVETDHVTVEPGDAAGIHQVAVGQVGGEPVIELDLRLYVGAPEARDAVSVRGDPAVELAIDGGLHGDVTTPAVVLNAVPRVREAEAGLATMLDLATPRFDGG